MQKRELTNKSVAVWGDFQNRLESKLSLCRNCNTRQLFLFKKKNHYDDAELKVKKNAFSEYLTHGTQFPHV